MRRKSNNFLEQYADKFILSIFAIVCLWLLIFQVLGSGSSVEYDSRKFGPSQIDNYIEAQARELEEKLNTKPDKPREYESKLAIYNSLLNSAINGVDVSLSLPLPNHGSKALYDERVYHIPQVGQVDDIAAQLVRGVAYNPLYETDTDSEGQADELLDVDLITVQGSFDAAGLYERFFESFAGKNIVEQWRDKKLATPIFAAVQLDRQKMAKDGSWPDEWQRVIRPKVDPLNETLKIPTNVSELQLGMEILMIQFDSPEVKIGLLQPEVYDFALPIEGWLPPSLFKQRQERLEKLRQEEERYLKEEERRKRREERGLASERRERDSRDVTTMGARRGGGRNIDTDGGRGRPTTTRRTTRRETERATRTPERRALEGTRGRPGREDMPEPLRNEQEQFEEIKLTELTNFEEMEKPLVFWAHDDTTEPGQTYRYRMRIGVLNPIAGTDWSDDESQHLKEQVILWSDYSAFTTPVTVPKKLYFFPVQVRESNKTLTVDVRKYSLGKWYGQNFKVKPGESIGQVVSLKKTDESDEFGPSSIDYQTGTILLDIVNVSDWYGITTLRRRDYSDVLYTQDGINIEHVPVQERYWPSDLRKKLEDINKKQAEQEQEPLALRGRSATGRRGATGRRARSPDTTERLAPRGPTRGRSNR